MVKKTLIALAVAASALTLSGCEDGAKIANQNIQKMADNFEVNRRIIFYNTWAAESLLKVEGRCSIEQNADRVGVICKTGPGQFMKHYLGKTGQVAYFSEQTSPVAASEYHYKITFKPDVIIPDFDLRSQLKGNN